MEVSGQPICLRGREARYPTNRKLGGPQSLSGSGDEEKNISARAGNQIPLVQPAF